MADTALKGEKYESIITRAREVKGNIVCADQFTLKQVENDSPALNLLQPIYQDGVLLKETTFGEIRTRLAAQ